MGPPDLLSPSPPPLQSQCNDRTLETLILRTISFSPVARFPVGHPERTIAPRPHTKLLAPLPLPPRLPGWITRVPLSSLEPGTSFSLPFWLASRRPSRVQKKYLWMFTSRCGTVDGTSKRNGQKSFREPKKKDRRSVLYARSSKMFQERDLLGQNRNGAM